MDTRIPRGLWLICGSSGCGKSYLLAKCMTDLRHNVLGHVKEIVICTNPVVKKTGQPQKIHNHYSLTVLPVL